MREMLLYKELKGDEKKEFENKQSDKAFICKQEFADKVVISQSLR